MPFWIFIVTTFTSLSQAYANAELCEAIFAKDNSVIKFGRDGARPPLHGASQPLQRDVPGIVIAFPLKGPTARIKAAVSGDSVAAVAEAYLLAIRTLTAQDVPTFSQNDVYLMHRDFAWIKESARFEPDSAAEIEAATQQALAHLDSIGFWSLLKARGIDIEPPDPNRTIKEPLGSNLGNDFLFLKFSWSLLAIDIYQVQATEALFRGTPDARTIMSSGIRIHMLKNVHDSLSEVIAKLESLRTEVNFKVHDLDLIDSILAEAEAALISEPTIARVAQGMAKWSPWPSRRQLGQDVLRLQERLRVLIAYYRNRGQTVHAVPPG